MEVVGLLTHPRGVVEVAANALIEIWSPLLEKADLQLVVDGISNPNTQLPIGRLELFAKEVQAAFSCKNSQHFWICILHSVGAESVDSSVPTHDSLYSSSHDFGS
jgi:hypothetical protein